MNKETKKTILIISLIGIISIGIISYAVWNDAYIKGRQSVQSNIFSDLVRYNNYNYVYTADNQTLMVSLVPVENACNICQLQLNNQQGGK